MLFNSIAFLIFLPIVFCLYWFITDKNLKLQNLLVVASSFLFYGWWDWRFLLLLVFSAGIDFFAGIYIGKSLNLAHRKMLLILSVFTNLGILALFKYFNFFTDNLVAGLSLIGLKLDSVTLNVVLPVGVSFYTFQALSYTIDVYKNRLKPTSDPVAYFAFISFFPQLVAGPIERATNLLPQFYIKREFDFNKAKDGLRQILWGFFKKIVIADSCASYADLIFNNSADYSGSTLFVGAIFFAFQIYGDFSGYSDIAIGTARLFGFDLMQNFAFPYFSRDIAEFWRRWHISLSTWFRDYLYYPLGGSRGSIWLKVRNTFIIFIVSGFWHGANWTFIAWGALNAIYFIPLLISKRNRNNLEIAAYNRTLPTFSEFGNIVLTFCLTVLAWIFFRAKDITHAFSIFSEIFSTTILRMPEVFPKFLIMIIILFVIAEWIGRRNKYALQETGLQWPRIVRWSAYYCLIGCVILYAKENQQFIYFQF